MQEEHENALKELSMRKFEGAECSPVLSNDAVRELMEPGCVDRTGHLTGMGIERQGRQ